MLRISESLEKKEKSNLPIKINIKNDLKKSQKISLHINKMGIKNKNNKKKEKDIHEKYQHMEHGEHIYKKPDTYVGSCEPEENQNFIFVEGEENQILKKDISLTPGWYKCFDELLVNAYDHKKRMDKEISKKNKDIHYPVTMIKITINEDDSISFYNDGDGILIEYMEKHKKYPPELIFGTLLTSTNYDDNDEREWGGRNGYGAKLANIFSKTFEIETVCHVNGKKFIQTFTNNMNDRTKPKITSVKSKPYTKITWLPDYERFGMKSLNDNMRNLIRKRVYDIAGVTDKGTKVYFNNKVIEIKSFEKYVNLYIGKKDVKQRMYGSSIGWEIVACSSSDDVFEHISYVNGIYTPRGGTHVDYIADQIKIKLSEYLKKKKKINVKPQIVKNQLKIFVNAYKIVNPVFDSQTKETLKTPKSKFGKMFDISDKFIASLAKTDIYNKIQLQAAYKDSQLLSKTDGSKKKKVKVNKYSGANKAGTKLAKECTIIFTEGDSAKTMAISGLSEVGRDFYGVYPLRGKILNVRDASTSQIMNCSVLNDIKQILGLQANTDYKKKYENSKVWPLRYGKILIMTDQDHDGSHIKGLMINLFDSMWPQLLDTGFITSMVTPIVKAFKKKNEKVFYTLQDYDKWKSNESLSKGWRVKYYKGLGTSSTKEAKEYFRQLKIISYYKTDEDKTNSQIDKAFNKKRADDRKVWLKDYNRDKYPNYNDKKMSYGEFIDHELIHFSNEDNDRSLPSMIDGLKPSQRKVLFACFKRNLKNEIKVAQLSGYVSEHASYHHGEVSLEKTIKNMAQDYVGANNINLLEPIGQFGTRLMGGDDSAQSRYIFTKLPTITRLIFKQSDDKLCKYLNDDGFPIEPEYYYPIIPMILVNGTTGIGTGFSSDIPKHSPKKIIKWILNKLDNIPNQIITPSYRGFGGRIEPTSPGKYITQGKYEIVNDSTINITELPIGVWTEKYILTLDKISVERGKENAKNFIRSYVDNSTDKKVNITIKMNPITLNKWRNKFGKDGINELDNRLKLTSSLSYNNIHLFNENGQITDYSSTEEILEEWFILRLKIYNERRNVLLKTLKYQLDIIKYKVRFINEIINETFEIRNVKKNILHSNLETKNYPKFPNSKNILSYDYLLTMDFYKLTEEEINDLNNKKEQKETEYNTLFNKSGSDLWKEDLEILSIEYKKSMKIFLKEYNEEVDRKSITKKKIKFKKKKKKIK
jgi:DNA topoisomerase II